MIDPFLGAFPITIALLYLILLCWAWCIIDPSDWKAWLSVLFWPVGVPYSFWKDYTDSGWD